MDAHGFVELDAVIVDEALGFKAPVHPFGNCGAHLFLGKIEQSLKTCECIRLAEFSDEFGDALLAEPACAQLTANVAEHQFRRSAVGGDDAFDLDIALAAAEIADSGKMQAVVEGLL